jgi:hypothetical protein
VETDLTAVSLAADKAREWRDRRDLRIQTALRSGASLRAVARAAGLSHAGVRKIRSRDVAR